MMAAGLSLACALAAGAEGLMTFEEIGVPIRETGVLYGMAEDSFFRLPPGGQSVEVLGRYPGANRGFALIGRDIYFGKGPTLCVGHLP